jgi:hypothetical protein
MRRPAPPEHTNLYLRLRYARSSERAEAALSRSPPCDVSDRATAEQTRGLTMADGRMIRMYSCPIYYSST